MEKLKKRLEDLINKQFKTPEYDTIPLPSEKTTEGFHLVTYQKLELKKISKKEQILHFFGTRRIREHLEDVRKEKMKQWLAQEFGLNSSIIDSGKEKIDNQKFGEAIKDIEAYAKDYKNLSADQIKELESKTQRRLLGEKWLQEKSIGDNSINGQILDKLIEKDRSGFVHALRGYLTKTRDKYAIKEVLPKINKFVELVDGIEAKNIKEKTGQKDLEKFLGFKENEVNERLKQLFLEALMPTPGNDGTYKEMHLQSFKLTVAGFKDFMDTAKAFQVEMDTVQKNLKQYIGEATEVPSWKDILEVRNTKDLNKLLFEDIYTVEGQKKILKERFAPNPQESDKSTGAAQNKVWRDYLEGVHKKLGTEKMLPQFEDWFQKEIENLANVPEAQAFLEKEKDTLSTEILRKVIAEIVNSEANTILNYTEIFKKHSDEVAKAFIKNTENKLWMQQRSAQEALLKTLRSKFGEDKDQKLEKPLDALEDFLLQNFTQTIAEAKKENEKKSWKNAIRNFTNNPDDFIDKFLIEYLPGVLEEGFCSDKVNQMDVKQMAEKLGDRATFNTVLGLAVEKALGEANVTLDFKKIDAAVRNTLLNALDYKSMVKSFNDSISNEYSNHKYPTDIKGLLNLEAFKDNREKQLLLLGRFESMYKVFVWYQVNKTKAVDRKTFDDNLMKNKDSKGKDVGNLFQGAEMEMQKGTQNKKY